MENSIGDNAQGNGHLDLNEDGSENTRNKLFFKVPLKDLSDPTKDLPSFEQNTAIAMNKPEIDPDTLCGIGSFKSEWMQKWATAKVFLVLHSIIGVISGTYYAYRVGVMSTLEKRFTFKSKTSGAIMMLDEITPLFLGAFIGYFGGKAHRPRLLGIGISMSVLCCFVSAFPYLIYGPSKQFNTISISNGTGTELCDDTVHSQNCDSDDRPPTLAAVFFFMLAGILKGFGNLAYHSIGMSYMDDNAKKKNTPLYFAVAFTLRLFGPMLGFLMSSVFLNIYENPFDDPGYGPDDPRWIGGWWMGFLLQGILLLLATIPISLFPRRLEGQKMPISNSDKENKSFRSNMSGLLVALKRLFVNPLYLAITLNTVFQIFGSIGHHMMLPKYMEHQFRMSASDASLYSGPPSITAVMISTMLGGYYIWKYRPSLTALLRGMIAMEVISAIGFFLLMIPKCEKLQMSNYGLNNNGLLLEGNCNLMCNCSTNAFTPVCGTDGQTVYFSPCYAGCEQNFNQSFSDCSCNSDTSDQEKQYVTEGLCVTEGCWAQAVAYVIAWPILQFLVSFYRVLHTIILFRCILPEDKSIALGVFEALICLFGFIPYLVIFGALVDTTCLVWEKSCGETGNCWFYDIDQFNNILHGLSGGFCAVSALTMLPIYFLRGRFYDLYEEDEDADPQNESESRNQDANVVAELQNILTVSK